MVEGATQKQGESGKKYKRKRQGKGQMILPVGYIPSGLCLNSMVASSRLRLRCTGILKIACQMRKKMRT